MVGDPFVLPSDQAKRVPSTQKQWSDPSSDALFVDLSDKGQLQLREILLVALVQGRVGQPKCLNHKTTNPPPPLNH